MTPKKLRNGVLKGAEDVNPSVRHSAAQGPKL